MPATEFDLSTNNVPVHLNEFHWERERVSGTLVRERFAAVGICSVQHWPPLSWEWASTFCSTYTHKTNMRQHTNYGVSLSLGGARHCHRHCCCCCGCCSSTANGEMKYLKWQYIRSQRWWTYFELLLTNYNVLHISISIFHIMWLLSFFCHSNRLNSRFPSLFANEAASSHFRPPLISSLPISRIILPWWFGFCREIVKFAIIKYRIFGQMAWLGLAWLFFKLQLHWWRSKLEKCGLAGCFFCCCCCHCRHGWYLVSV